MLAIERLEQRTLLTVGALNNEILANSSLEHGLSSNVGFEKPSKPTVSFDSSSGRLTIEGNAESNFVRESLTEDGFVELTIDGVVKSSNVRSLSYDPAIAGATRKSLREIIMDGGGGDDHLVLADQSLSGGLLVHSDDAVAVEGSIHAADRFVVTASLIEVDGLITAPGGYVSLQSTMETSLRGSIDVSAASGRAGGRVELLGPQITLAGSAAIDASGDSGGGVVLVGGDYQGGNPNIDNSRQTLVEENAKIRADGLVKGNGGRVIVWSDVTTRFQGAINAHGGEFGGDGGFVEVSGKNSLTFTGKVDALAPQGTAGTLLLDPKFVVIATGGASTLTLVDQFADNTTGTETIDPAVINAAGANVVIQANTDITINNPIAIAGAGRTLTLRAGRDILINANVSTMNAAITMTANDNGATPANRDAGTGDIVMAAGTALSSGTGAITLSIGTSVTAPFSPGSMTLASITTTSGAQVYAADEIDFIGGANSVVGGSTITLRPVLTTTSVVVAGATDSGASVLDLTTTDLAAIKDGFTGVTIGQAASASSTSTMVNTSTFTDPLTVLAGLGTLGVAGSLTLGANALSLQGDEINFSGGGNTIIGTSSLTLQQTGTAVSIAVAGAADSGATVLDLTTTDLAAIKDGFTSIVVGLATATAVTITAVNSAVFTDPLTLRSGLGTLNIAGILNLGANALSLQGNEINCNGGGNSVIGASSLTLQQTSTGSSIAVAGAADSGASILDLTSTDLAAFKDGFTSIVIGLTTATVATSTTVNSLASPDPLSLRAGLGTLIVAGAVAMGANALTLSGNEINLNGGNNSITGTSTLAIQATGTTTPMVVAGLSDSGAANCDLTLTELAAITDGFSAITIGLSTSTVGMTVNSATFSDPVTLQSGGVAGSITLAAGATVSSGANNLTFTAGTGNTGLFTQAAGASIVNSTGGITINADSIDLAGGAGSIASAGTLALAVRTTTRPMVVGAAGAASDFALSTAELAALADGFSAITIGLSTSTVGMTVNTATFSDPVTLQSGGVAGSITLAAGATISSGTNNLTFTAGTGNTGLFTQTAGASIVNSTGGITINADSIALGGVSGSIAGTGTIALTARTAARPVVVGAAGAATDFALSTAELAVLADGFSGITIGSNALTGVATMNSATFSDPITILMGGASGDITLSGALTTAAANASITLTTGTGGGGTFTQTAGVGNSISAGSGAIAINSDNIVLNTTANTVSGTGTITLSPTTAARPVVIGAAGAATDFALSTAELAALSDGFSSITIGASSLTGVATVSSATFNDPITILMGGASGDITLSGALSTAAANAAITLLTGTGGGGTFTQTAGAGNSISAGSGAITINTDNIVLNTTASTLIGTGTTTLSPTTAARPVVIGAAGAATDFALSTAELAALANGFNGIIIGSNAATGTATVSSATFNDPITILMGGASGDITVSGALSTAAGDSISLSTGAGGAIALNGQINAGSGNVVLNSGQSVSQTASITAAGLLLLGTSTFALDMANDVDHLAADIVGSLSFSDIDDLTVGTVGLTVGISTGIPGLGGTVEITASGRLTVNATIDTSGGSGGILTATGAVLNATPIVGAGDILLSGLNLVPALDLDANNSSGQGGAGFVAVFVEDGGAVAIADADAALTDADSPQLASLTVTITNVFDGTAESLAADVSGTSISANYNTATGVLLLNGLDTLAHYQQVLRTIAYNNASHTPDATARVITLVANDGIDPGNTASCTLTVTALNDAPASADQTVTTDEDAAYTFGISDFPFSDAEGGNLVKIQVTALPTKGTLRLSGVEVTVNQEISAADIAAGNLRFVPTANANGAPYDAFAFKVHDGTVFSALSRTMTVNVTAVNDAPVLTAVNPALGIMTISSSKTVSLTGTFINQGIGTTTIVDLDENSVVGGIALAGVAGGGIWEYSLDGTTFQAVGSIDSSSSLLLAKESILRYTPNGPSGETAAITYRAWDATTGMNGGRVDLSQPGAVGGETPYSGSADTASLEVRAQASDITLSNSSFRDNLPVGATVGLLNAVAAPGGRFTYTLVSGEGSADNSCFSLSGDMLLTAAAFNAGIKNSFSIRVRATDEFSLSFEKMLAISLIDVTPPGVTIVQATSQTDPAHRWPINFSVAFSEPVSDFTADDVLIAGTAPGARVSSITGSGAAYEVHIEGMTESGTVIAAISSGRVHDAAGNSNLRSLSTDDTVHYIHKWATYGGTFGSDTFVLSPAATPGDWVISVNGTSWNISATMQGVTLDSSGGNDRIQIVGNGNDEILEVWQDRAVFMSDSFRVEIANFESFAFDGGRGSDTAILHDRASESDVFSVGAGWAIMNGGYIPLVNVESCTIVGTAGSHDTAILYAAPNSAGRNAFAVSPDLAVLTMPGCTNTVRNFANVQAYTIPGGGDAATFTDSAGDDIFVASPLGAQLFSRRGEYDFSAWGFSRVTANATTGNDLARFYGQAGGGDSFVASPLRASYANAAFENRAIGFRSVEAYADPNGDSTATLWGSDGADRLVTSPLGAQLFSQGVNNSAWSFRRIISQGVGGNDFADMYGASANNRLSADSVATEFANASFCNRAMNFTNVRVHGSAEGMDSAVLDHVLVETGIHDSPSSLPPGISVIRKFWIYDFDHLSVTENPHYSISQPQAVDRLMSAFMYE